MAHIPHWHLVSLEAHADHEPPLITAVWQCVTCAVFLTEYAVPDPPPLRRHRESKEQPDA